MRLPEKGQNQEDVLAALEAMRKDDIAWRSGRVFAYVYDGGRELEDLAKKAYSSFLTENGLDPFAFRSLLSLENEVLAMASQHLGGGPDAAGVFTSGGTESLILAVKTARDAFRAEHPDVASPSMVLPDTAHPAFHKAAHYLGVRTIVVPTDPKSFRAVPDAMRAAIQPDTCLLVASAASYAHGVVDPIEALGRVALEKKVLFHVDGCIGGFLLPLFRKLGDDIAPFDLSVPGVTSVSMDLHKYALCPKGASVVVYKDRSLRRHQVFAFGRWPGYGMVNTTVQSSKSGGPVAAAWAVMKHLGEEGYLKVAAGLRGARDQVVRGIGAIPGLRVLGRPELCLVAFASDEIDVFVLADRMEAKGWHLQPQLSFGASPANLHLTLQPGNLPHLSALVRDLETECAALRGKERMDVTGIAGAIADQLRSDASPEAVRAIVGGAGGGTGRMPTERAFVNWVLDALPPDLRERVFVDFINDAFTAAT